ncbi:uncharacterized protein LOC109365369 [Meleagris gallopavo]|uniref:uncharacterized protein LOC109365369 n=1 Tax=Meleagris gallopavo TaxID=9103 RepID=UPI0012ABF33D|nr:uncharacterized protein LOC109365369 [Meleagris gallopavo]
MTPWHLKNNMTPTTKCCCWLALSKMVWFREGGETAKGRQMGVSQQWDQATSMTLVYETCKNSREGEKKKKKKKSERHTESNAPFSAYLVPNVKTGKTKQVHIKIEPIKGKAARRAGGRQPPRRAHGERESIAPPRAVPEPSELSQEDNGDARLGKPSRRAKRTFTNGRPKEVLRSPAPPRARPQRGPLQRSHRNNSVPSELVARFQLCCSPRLGPVPGAGAETAWGRSRRFRDEELYGLRSRPFWGFAERRGAAAALLLGTAPWPCVFPVWNIARKCGRWKVLFTSLSQSFPGTDLSTFTGCTVSRTPMGLSLMEARNRTFPLARKLPRFRRGGGRGDDDKEAQIPPPRGAGTSPASAGPMLQ